jgi:hypothetical protein
MERSIRESGERGVRESKKEKLEFVINPSFVSIDSLIPLIP